MQDNSRKEVEAFVESIEGLIVRALKELGLHELAVFHTFNSCIPEKLKGMCEAERLDGKTLLVKAAHSAVAQEISMKKESIIKKTNELLGESDIEDIRVI